MTKRAPTNGWDEPAEIKRSIAYLADLDNDYVDVVSLDLDSVIEVIYSYGMAEDRTWSLMFQRWPKLEKEPDLRSDLLRRIAKVYDETEKPPGYAACGDEFEKDREPEFPVNGLSVQRGSDVRMEAIRWLWPERIPENKLTIFAGFPDQGKSQAMASVAAKVTTGGEWPNAEGHAPKGAVIYLSAEDDTADTLKPRMVAAGADMDNIIFIKSMVREVKTGRKTTRVFNLEDDLKKLTQILESERKKGRIVRAIMFDPLNAFYGGAKKVDSNNAADMRALLTPIAEWTAQHKITVLGVLHFNKAENAHMLYRVTGSMAVGAAARATWYFNRDPDSERKDEQFVMVQGKHNLSRSIEGLSYKIQTREVREDLDAPLIRAPYVEWLGPTALTADDAFAIKRRDREAEAVNTALKYLKEAFMGVGVILAAEQMEECRNAASVSEMTWRRAKEQLGVVCIRAKHVGERATYRLRTAADDFADELNGVTNSVDDQEDDAESFE